MPESLSRVKLLKGFNESTKLYPMRVRPQMQHALANHINAPKINLRIVLRPDLRHLTRNGSTKLSQKYEPQIEGAAIRFRKIMRRHMIWNHNELAKI